VHFLLGPATVALAVPLYHQLTKLKRLWLPLALSIISGVTIAALCSIGIAAFLGASPETLFSLAPKSATAPVAMGLTAHGIGTARAFQINREMGAFSGLDMALSAFATAIILPWLVTQIAPYL
jgi:putative effector of murein hydrolase